MSLDAVPVWAILVATIVLVVLSIEAGRYLGEIAHRRSEQEKESTVSAFAGAVLGLLAFILAFTFSIATNRYDTRKALVRDEANAIGTAYLRTDFLPEADRARAKQLFKEYLDRRVDFALAGTFDPAQFEAMQPHTQRIQKELWDMAVTNARKDMDSDVAALYIESLNEVFDIHSLRVAVGGFSRIPLGIWSVLVGLTVLGMLGVGYQTGIAGSNRSVATVLLALAFAIVICVIATLDRPGGYITVSQQPLVDLQKEIGGGD
jgi:hypothetical protein